MIITEPSMIRRKVIKQYASICRVSANKSRGSCTIIYSQNGLTYAITNFHVIQRNIKYKVVWNSLLKKDVKKEFTESVEILFPRLAKDRILGFSTVVGEIVAYDEQQDMALLKFRDDQDYPSIKWLEKDKSKSVPILSKLACIGAALGQKPVCTFGHLNGVQIEIDNYEYWLSSAPSIFGNSGGGVFVLDEDNWKWVGIPSRISVVPIGFGGSAVTHIGYFIPIFRIYEWLEEQCYQFLYNNEFTPEECEKMREEHKKDKMREMLLSGD